MSRRKLRQCHKVLLKLEEVSTVDKELQTFFLDIKKGKLEINGEEVKKVTAFTLFFENGKYGLMVSRDELFKASIQ